MKRSWHACWTALIAASASLAAAQDISPAPTQSLGEEAPVQAIAAVEPVHSCVCRGAHGLEAILHEPADLEIPSDRPVSVADILDQLHKRHGFSIRFDIPTFSALYGVGSASVQQDTPPCEKSATKLNT